MKHHGLTLGQRIFVAIWQRVTVLMAGFPDRFAPEFVRTFGIREFVSWVKTSFEISKLLEKRWGPIESQMIIAFAAIWSGCRWCSMGHLLTGNLELFKREGELGPLDEMEIPKLQMMRDPEVLEVLLDRFSGERWKEFSKIILRQYQLRSGRVEEESRDDELLQMASFMWEWINECTITGMDIEPHTIPAQTPINKDQKLIQRYHEARKQKALPADRP